MATEMLEEICFMQNRTCFGVLLWLHEHSGICGILDRLIN